MTPQPSSSVDESAPVKPTYSVQNLFLGRIYSLVQSLKPLMDDPDDRTPFKQWEGCASSALEILLDLIPGEIPPPKSTPDFKQTAPFAVAIHETRTALVQCIDALDAYCSNRSWHVHSFCPASCIALAPSPATPRPLMSYASQSVQTDFVFPPHRPPPPPLFAPPAPAPKAYASQATETDPVPSPMPLPHVPSRPAMPIRSYADMAAPPPGPVRPGRPCVQGPPRSLPPHVPTPCKAPAPSDPVRYVVHYGGTSPAHLRASPIEPFRVITLALTLRSGPHVPLLGANFNRAGNLLLAFPASTPDSAVQPLIPTICSALALDPAIPVSRVVPWAKVLISSVPARESEGSLTFSEQAIWDSLVANQPVSSLHVTCSPRWVRNPSTLTKAASSVTLSFEDPDGSVLRGLLRARLFAFGAPVTVKRWLDKPRPSRGPAPAPPDMDTSA